MMPDQEKVQSPKWSTVTKTVVSLALIAVLVALLVRFKYIVGPVLIASIIAYLIHPLASFITNRLHIPWKVTVTLLYLIFVAALIGLLTWGGISIVNEIQNLIGFLNTLVTDLPKMVSDFLSKSLVIGPFTIDLPRLDLTGLWTWLQSMIQPAITETANLVGSIASGAASIITWIGFTFLISYFIASETKGGSQRMVSINIPLYQSDLNRIGTQLSRIWNSFLRGQLIVITITIIWYTLLLGSVGVNFFFGLAILAGLARFVPYIGPFVAWATYFLVGLFQGSNIFGLQPFWFGVLLVVMALVSDFVIDNFVSPRVMSNTLKVHPAGVLVTVLIAANLFGVIGMLLAAPVLASVKLIFNYIVKKLFDLDPWEGLQTYPKPLPLREEIRVRLRKVEPVVDRVLKWIKALYDKIKQKLVMIKSNKATSKKKEN